MKKTAERLTLVFRALLLVFCCTLFIPQGLHAEYQQDLNDSIRSSSIMTLAISGTSDPVSQIQKLAGHEGTSLRGSGQRTGFAANGKRTSLSSPAKRDGQGSPDLADGDSPLALPGLPPLPSAFSCAKAHFSFRVPLPESHGHIHWYSLAPPASRNA